MLRRLICRLLRHRHGQAVIYVNLRDGGRLTSPVMDEWSANYIVVNHLGPTAMWGDRPVESARVVVL